MVLCSNTGSILLKQVQFPMLANKTQMFVFGQTRVKTVSKQQLDLAAEGCQNVSTSCQTRSILGIMDGIDMSRLPDQILAFCCRGVQIRVKTVSTNISDKRRAFLVLLQRGEDSCQKQTYQKSQPPSPSWMIRPCQNVSQTDVNCEST